jgi:glycosyltransferase 2 family protein
MNKAAVKKIVLLLFGGSLLVMVFMQVNPKEQLKIFLSLSLWYILLLFLISFGLIHVSVLKWNIFLRSMGVKERVVKLWRLYLVGYFVNTFFPSQLGGDIARSMLLDEKSKSVAGTFLERYTGLLAMILLSLISVFFVKDRLGTAIIRYALYALLLLFIKVLFLSLLILSEKTGESFKKLFINRDILPEKIYEKSCIFFEKVQRSFREVRKTPRVFVAAMFLSFLFHLLTIVNTLCAAYAVGWMSVPVMELAVVLPVILMISSLPLSPSGIGVQEGAFYFFLTRLGAAPEQALAIGLILRAKVLVLGIIGGLFSMNVIKKKYTFRS